MSKTNNQETILQDIFSDNFVSPTIDAERKKVLQPLIRAIQAKVDAKDTVQLNFVCTHNSRRSQFAQVWATVASRVFNVEARCYSSGVEVTAVHQNVLDSLERFGFMYSKSDDENPLCVVSFKQKDLVIRLRSKLIEHPENPSNNFIAVMVCDHANESCPFIAGASQRIPLTYKDPKIFDGTVKETEGYDTRSFQIATELRFVFSQIKH